MWFNNGNSYTVKEENKTAYAIATQKIMKGSLVSPSISTTKAQNIPNEVTDFGKGNQNFINIISKYMVRLLNAHYAIWKEQRLLASNTCNKPN